MQTKTLIVNADGWSGREKNPHEKKFTGGAYNSGESSEYHDFEAINKNYPLTEWCEPGSEVVCKEVYFIRFKNRYDHGQYKPWFEITKNVFDSWVMVNGCPWQTKAEYQPIKENHLPDEGKEVEEVIYLNINDFAISEEDLERAFAFGYLANQENNCLDNKEMMRRYEIFKTQYLLPMLSRKHIID